MKRLIIKTVNADGIPANWEMCNFQHKHGVEVTEVNRLYVAFKVGKRKKLKRLRIRVDTLPCELCGRHVYVRGKVGSVEFDKEIF